MLNKNMKADLTNPNVYHSIDENNEEHVYDEIKHKEGYKDPGIVSFHKNDDKKCSFFLNIILYINYHL